MMEHPFGRTGHHSTRAIFGGVALAGVSQADADRTLEVLLRYGINHIDTAASYGESEVRIGPWMKDHRRSFFVATKTVERSYQPAFDEIRRSLERMKVDQLDLLQLHALTDEKEWQTAFGPGGALEAAIEARRQGLTRFIGITGHGTTVAAMHLRSLERFDFDSVLLPYNYPMMQNKAYAADLEKLVAVCEKKKVAFQTIKATARGNWGEGPRKTATWYDSLVEQPDLDAGVAYVLSRPGFFLNMAGDIGLVPKLLEASVRYFTEHETKPYNAAATEAALAKLKMAPLFT